MRQGEAKVSERVRKRRASEQKVRDEGNGEGKGENEEKKSVEKMGVPKYINIASRAKIAFAVNSSRDPQFLRSVAGRPKLRKAFTFIDTKSS